MDDLARDYLAAKDEARRLAVSLHAKHFADVPQWRPLTDLRGLISQIDNMTTALSRTPEAPLTEPTEGEVEPVAMRYDCDDYGYRYIDGGSGSDWRTRHPDAEPLYTSAALRAATPAPDVVELLREARQRLNDGTRFHAESYGLSHERSAATVLREMRETIDRIDAALKDAQGCPTMTKTTDLEALAVRCETATGPDRELDREIARHVIERILVKHGEPEAEKIADAMAAARLDEDLATYTASIDSALTMVPEGWARRSTWCPKAHYPARWSLNPPGPIPAVNEDMLVQAVGYTDAATLAAAALRARAS